MLLTNPFLQSSVCTGLDVYKRQYHLAFTTDQYEKLHSLHEQMGVICYENPSMGIYFIADPDGYWIEIVPEKA